MIQNKFKGGKDSKTCLKILGRKINAKHMHTYTHIHECTYILSKMHTKNFICNTNLKCSLEVQQKEDSYSSLIFISIH